MTPRRQHLTMRLFVLGLFVCGGAGTYSLAHWLAWNDPAYTRVFSSPVRPVALLAGIIDREGVWWPLALGLLLGTCVVAVHARRWLLLPAVLLLVVVAAIILQTLQ
jgi:hypothetical protein